MFTTIFHNAVDSIQSGKKQFVSTFVTQEGLAKPLNQFIDSQAAYTKSAIDAGIATATSMVMFVNSREFYESFTKFPKK
jgi:hypothetical protein